MTFYYPTDSSCSTSHNIKIFKLLFSFLDFLTREIVFVVKRQDFDLLDEVKAVK